MPFSLKKTILLTGAGFTCNVGGLSGKEFRNRLFNNDALKEIEPVFRIITMPGSDYESIYRDVLDEGSEFDDEHKKTVIKAYDEAYLDLDRRICSTCEPPAPLNLNSLSKFLDWFGGAEGQREMGHIFTLNQDLFLERGYFGSAQLAQPGILYPQLRSHWVPLDKWETNGHGPSPFRTIPEEEKVEQLRQQEQRTRLQYLKLHGSMNWRRKEGSPVMVIAGKKKEQIQSIPMLRWYFEKFTEIFSHDELHLLIIGYGFGDPHINEVLAQAIDEHGLVCSLLHPERDRDKVIQKLSEQCQELAQQDRHPDHTDTLIRGLERGQYFDGDLGEAFASHGQPWDTDLGRRLLDAFGPK